MSDLETRTVPRWRMVVFWILAVAVIFLVGGNPDRAHLLHGLFTAWGGYTGELASHEIHALTQSAMVWALIAAFLVNVRRPTRQTGSAWQYGVIATVWMLGFLTLGDMPAEAVPIIIGVLVISVLAFVAHPSPMRERFRSAEGPSRLMFGLVAVAAVPLAIHATGQLRIHFGSGPGDAHFEFGHWLSMAVFAFVIVATAAVAASRVSGWRVNAWSAGLLVAILGAGSLAVSAASQLDTLWAVAAVVWGVAFITVSELEARGAFGASDRRVEVAPAA